MLNSAWVMWARRRWRWLLIAFVVLTMIATLCVGWLLDAEAGTIGEWLSGIGTPPLWSWRS